MKKINLLKSKVQSIIARTEYKSQKINGVSCSRSDQETIVMYCDNMLQNGGRISGLMEPCGNVADVFKKAGIL